MTPHFEMTPNKQYYTSYVENNLWYCFIVFLSFMTKLYSISFLKSKLNNITGYGGYFKTACIISVISNLKLNIGCFFSISFKII